ncbi:hypothetical protein Dsin_012182 [Dipteronia sinensis]|uniref:Histone-lysine N-methyltransferase, H3 lysine-9 specific SUVH1 n=1 Tax=Dipteronia sinensis TaxID=43782 RepID=A0AAE0E883_9ROSI|nr:hypothetical protein Dsin_012182 [Dipteronia sinensis]
MDQTLGHDSAPASGSVDKSRVWDVTPLRRLVPVFPSQTDMSSFPTPPAGAPFICVPPTGPFPSEVAPFYPFFGSLESQRHHEQNPQTPFGSPNPNVSFGYNNPISDAVPLNSFRSPPPSTAGVTPIRRNGDTDPQYLSGFSIHISDVEGSQGTSKSGGSKNKSQKRRKGSRGTNFTSPEVDMDAILNNILSPFNVMEFDESRKADGDKESVGYILLIFDLFRRKISQLEDSREATITLTRRPDLKAGAILMNKGIRTNSRKRIGLVPGVEVGDIFFFRMEMCLVGLHSQSMAGIDYMGLKSSQEEEPLAVSIVSSGGYEDNVEDADVLIYSGQGGNIYRKDKDVMDQKLERGNLALDKSFHKGNEIRVIRGVKDVATPSGKIYVYDGLYKIQESWLEKGKSGVNVYKYKLVRLSGQREVFMTWRLIQQWKDGITSRSEVILPDLTSGAENIPVSLVNEVDDEKGPKHFTYFPSLKYSKTENSAEPSVGCTCRSGCLPNNSSCSCIQKNAGYLPYAINGILVNQNSLTHECGFSCLCPSNCRNRLSQGGLRVRLEVFKTKGKGWALRSWDPIRAGAFICEYAGEVIDMSEIEKLGGEIEDDYVFDATRTRQLAEPLPDDSHEAPKIPFPLIINAKAVGNVARFMNHSCSPNVFWQPILRESNKDFDLHIAFHAIKHIPPMTELTYDYGIPDKAERKKNCLCGSSKCRGYFY